MPKRFIVTVSGLFLSFCAFAQVYKMIDPNGEVLYTDKQGSIKSAEKVQIKEPMLVHFPPSYGENLAQEPIIARPSYEELSIVTPAHGETLREIRTITVRVQLTPELYRGDKLQLLMDGTLTGEAQTSTTFVIENLERGTHNLEVVLKDVTGQVLKRASSTFYLHLPMAKRPAK